MRANTRSNFSAIIANGESLSGVVDIAGTTLIAIQMPSAWTSANLTFQGSADGSVYADVYNDAGDEYNIPVAASRFVMLDQVENRFRGMRYFKVRSGTTGTPVNQGSARTITLICA